MKKIIKIIKEKIEKNILIHSTIILVILMILNIFFEFLQKLKK